MMTIENLVHPTAPTQTRAPVVRHLRAASALPEGEQEDSYARRMANTAIALDASMLCDFCVSHHADLDIDPVFHDELPRITQALSAGVETVMRNIQLDYLASRREHPLLTRKDFDNLLLTIQSLHMGFYETSQWNRAVEAIYTGSSIPNEIAFLECLLGLQ